MMMGGDDDDDDDAADDDADNDYDNDNDYDDDDDDGDDDCGGDGDDDYDDDEDDDDDDDDDCDDDDGTLRPSNGCGIPIAARQESGTLFFHGVYQYHVPGANQASSKYCIALQGLFYLRQGAVDKPTLFVHVTAEANENTWPSKDTKGRLGGGIAEIPRCKFFLADSQNVKSSLAYVRCAAVRASQPIKWLA